MQTTVVEATCRRRATDRNVVGTHTCLQTSAGATVADQIAAAASRQLIDDVIDRDAHAFALRVAQLREDFERLVGACQIESVNRDERVTVHQAELREHRRRPDRIDLEAVRLAVLDRRHDARSSRLPSGSRSSSYLFGAIRWIA